MTIIENPPGFVVKELARKAAFDRGYGLSTGEQSGWLGWKSTTADGEIWTAAAGQNGPWYLSVNHAGVASEMGADNEVAPVEGPGVATFVFPDDGRLTRAIDRAYRLARSLPDAPLAKFQARTKNLPKTTEAERLVVQRIGQDEFRKALLEYWNGACPLTGITDTALLRASHIVRWADCESDAQRLDAHNGLLLSSLWDAAFDAGLVSFTDDGAVLVSEKLGDAARAELKVDQVPPLKGLKEAHYANLAAHRKRNGFA